MESLKNETYESHSGTFKDIENCVINGHQFDCENMINTIINCHNLDVKSETKLSQINCHNFSTKICNNCEITCHNFKAQAVTRGGITSHNTKIGSATLCHITSHTIEIDNLKDRNYLSGSNIILNKDYSDSEIVLYKAEELIELTLKNIKDNDFKKFKITTSNGAVEIDEANKTLIFDNTDDEETLNWTLKKKGNSYIIESENNNDIVIGNDGSVTITGNVSGSINTGISINSNSIHKFTNSSVKGNGLNHIKNIDVANATIIADAKKIKIKTAKYNAEIENDKSIKSLKVNANGIWINDKKIEIKK